METLTVKSHVGKDGVLKLELPVHSVDVDVDVVVVVSPVHEGVVNKNEGPAAGKWLRAHVHKTHGSIKDPTFVRPPQGEYEKREELVR